MQITKQISERFFAFFAISHHLILLQHIKGSAQKANLQFQSAKKRNWNDRPFFLQNCFNGKMPFETKREFK